MFQIIYFMSGKNIKITCVQFLYLYNKQHILDILSDRVVHPWHIICNII